MGEKKHKLLIIGPTHGVYGGMEAFMIAIAEAAMQWEEYEVRICFKLVKYAKAEANLINAAEKICDKVDFIDRGSLKLFNIIWWADILHVQNTPPDVIFTAKLLAKRIFLTIHNWRRTEKNIHNILWGYAAKCADKRWYNSKFVWDTWEPIKKSNKSDAFPTVSKFSSGWCAPEKRMGFIFLGRWIENKGIEEILRAYALNNFDVEKYPLTILGDGPIRPVVLKLKDQLNLQKINIPGFVDAKTKEELLISAKWLLSPANTKEDMGLTPIEARSVGVPSIVTRDGGLPEAGGPAAFIAEPGDVDSLAKCMQRAMIMSDEEYLKRTILAKDSLKGFLRPIEFYRKAFLDKE
ncbi:Glycosyltransferase involved in cell wall bisynthesis [Maribacter dokdonensis]|uniref:Glycosyltransferase involved in cell wall bisynthesis n=1 Tax=Maribacter dokdonensis TaxID=320912 RepID=A0A1H4MDN0_9FLAO|nr:glycosyltransferase family 4 protein [Maribacter dokdonensis]SEB81136.1 Glycosyltransferase involved in cell wall bisynthesis [Maribacter dokdonensis]